jgi:Trk-type K+ transport system membrane component
VNEVAEDFDGAALALGAQLGAAAGLVLLMVIIHILGLLGTARLLHLRGEELDNKSLDARSIVLLGAMGVLLFALHMFEIFVFAIFYLAVGGMQTLEEALFYSASAYATLGWTADYFPPEWRLIGAIEALVGFLMLGWSTAFVVATMNRLRD